MCEMREQYMPNIKLIKEPGYINDLFFIYYLKFNKEYCLLNMVNKDKLAEDTKYYEKIIDDFSPISDDMFLFFYAKSNGRCFMATYYLNPYKDLFTTSYNFEFLQTELSKYDQVIENLIEFYFPNLSKSDSVKYKDSIEDMSALIDESAHDELVKRKLYSFFIKPKVILQKLSYELMTKEFLLSKYYEQNYKRIIDIQNTIDFDSLSSQIKPFRDIEFALKEDMDVNVSVCLLHKNYINVILQTVRPTLLLGVDFEDCIEYMKSQRIELALKDFGDVVTEQNRVDILDLLLERKEITIKDLEKILNYTGSTAYYHVTMMLRFKILKSRNQGRTVYYSINEEYFRTLIDVLDKYVSNGGLS